MKIIIGLGNPGEKYEGTRHNVGFAAVDELAKELGASDWKEEKKFKALVSISHRPGAAKSPVSTKTNLSSPTNTRTKSEEKILLVKPLTFMNLSGESAAALMNFYKVAPADIWAIYDDIDLPFGQIRVRKGGGPGTHNGMKSLVSLLGTKEFPRIRIGIESRGVHAPEHQDLHSFVLERFTSAEKKLLKTILQKSAAAVKAALQQGIETAMNQQG